MIYIRARWADEACTKVIGWDAEGNSETVAADYAIFRQPDDGPVGFVNNGGVIEPYEPPVVTPPTARIDNSGLVRATGVSPCTILENIRMSGVTRIAKGRYRVTHETAMPTDQYSVMASVFSVDPRNIRVTARTPQFIEVRVTDEAGVAQDATEFTVKAERVVS